MLDSGLKEKFIGMAKEVSDFNEFSFELEGYLPRNIDFDFLDEVQGFVKFVKRWKYGWLNKYDGQVT